MYMSSWLFFVLSSLLIALFLYLPGCVVLFNSGIKRINAISFAPLISIFLLTLVSIVSFFLRVALNWWQMLTLLLAVSIIFSLVARHFSLTDKMAYVQDINRKPLERDWGYLGLYVFVGCVVCFLFFVKPLDGPDSFVPLFDNAWHVNLVRSYSNNGFYSPLNASLDIRELISIGGVSFYPSVIHCLAALSVCAFGVTPMLALNSVIAIFIAVVFPIGVFVFLRHISRSNMGVMLGGAASMLAFSAFPWRFLVWGPLYPNLASYSLIPSFLFCFIYPFKSNAVKERVLFALLSIVGIFAMAVTQPNADFTAAAILIPYCSAFLFSSFRKSSKKKATIITSLFVLACTFLWLILYSLPVLSTVTSYNWEPVSNTTQAVINVVTLAFTDGMTQPVLAALVIIGMIKLLAGSASNYWIVGSYCFLACIYIVSASISGELQHIVSGFWYTDSNRTAASLVLVLIPLAAYGIGSIFDCATRYFKQVESRVIKICLPTISVVALSICIFLPTHYLAGVTDIVTAFGYTTELLTSYNSYSTTFSISADELAFAKKVEEIVGENDVVLNNPFDGSAFLYAYSNLNTYYKAFIHEDADTGRLSDSDAGRSLRHDIDEWSTNQNVASLLEDRGIRYVLLLDAGGLDSELSTFDNNYTEDYEAEFEGLNCIDENTPGFSLVLRSGDMLLFRIDY